MIAAIVIDAYFVLLILALAWKRRLSSVALNKEEDPGADLQ